MKLLYIYTYFKQAHIYKLDVSHKKLTTLRLGVKNIRYRGREHHSKARQYQAWMKAENIKIKSLCGRIKKHYQGTGIRPPRQTIILLCRRAQNRGSEHPASISKEAGDTTEVSRIRWK